MKQKGKPPKDPAHISEEEDDSEEELDTFE